MKKLKQLFLTACMVMMASSVFATTFYSRANGDWNSTTTWSTVGLGGAVASSTPVAGDIVNIGGGFTVTVTANHTCAAVQFASSTTGEVFINSGNTLEITNITVMYGDANTPSAFKGTGTVSCKGILNVFSATGGNYNGGTGGGGARIQCAMILPSTIQLLVGGSANTTCKLVITGVISGAGGFYKDGNSSIGLGQLELWANNTYTGLTTINNGKVEARTVNALGTTASGTVVGAAGDLILLRNVNFAAEALTINGGKLTANDGNCTWNGTISVTGTSTIRLISNGAELDINGNISTAAGSILWFVGNTDGNIIVDGVISGSGSVRKTGQGMFLTLNGSNTFSGGVDLQEGKINLGDAAALGSGTLTLNQQSASDPIKLDNTSASIFLTVVNDINWNSPFSYVGSSGVLILTGDVILGTAPLGRSVKVESLGLFINGKITGVYSNAWSKLGPGALALFGDNSFEGSTTILEGLVSAFNRKAFGKSTNTIVCTKGVLELGTNVSIANYNVKVNGTAFKIISHTFTSSTGVSHSFFDLEIGNSELTIEGGSRVTSGNAWVIFKGDVTYTGTPTFITKNGASATAKLALGALNNNGNTATFEGNGSVLQKGIWSGTGGIILNSGDLRLDFANSYSGETKMNGGDLYLNNNMALGATSGLFTINGGQILNSRGGSTTITKDRIKLNGDLDYKGFTLASPESLTLNSALTMNGDRIINVRSGLLTLNGTINTKGQYHSLTKTGVDTLSLGTSLAYVENMTITEGVFMAPNSSGSLVVYGNFANSGEFLNSGGKVTFFTHNTSKTISSTTGTLSFWDVLKSGVGTNTVNSAMTVGGDMKFHNGTFTIGTGSLTFLDNATTSFGNNNSHVIGAVSKIGDDDFHFPTGGNGRLAIIFIDPTTGSSNTDVFTAQYFGTSHSNTASLGSGVNNVSIVEYWNLVQTTGTTTADVSLFSNDATFSGVQSLNTADLFVANYQGGTWKNIGNVDDAGYDFGMLYVYMEDFTTFGDFTFGSQTGNNYLGLNPPGMLDAVVTEGRTTSGEFNGQEAAANLKDNNTLTNTSSVGSINIYPNPSNGLVNITYPKGANATSVTVTDMTGAQVFGASGMVNQIDLSHLATGVYMVQINEADATTVKRLMIRK